MTVNTLSTQKYYHIVRLMGRSAFNIALEVALLTSPNGCHLGEEVQQGNESLEDIRRDIVGIRAQLMMDRDLRGNVQVAKTETEKLLAGKLRAQFHVPGYEGRAGMPSISAASYSYAAGENAANLWVTGRTGLTASVKYLLAPFKEWNTLVEMTGFRS